VHVSGGPSTRPDFSVPASHLALYFCCGPTKINMRERKERREREERGRGEREGKRKRPLEEGLRVRARICMNRGGWGKMEEDCIIERKGRRSSVK
jgi:hypothetical protein